MHAAALAANAGRTPMHADAALRRALLEHVRPEVADGGTTVEAQLTAASDPGALFRGWSLLASSAAAFADAGTVEDIGRTRWLRRLRRTARKASSPARRTASSPTQRSSSSASPSTGRTSTPSTGASAGSSRA